MRTAVFPSRYVQGPGALGRLADECAPFAARVSCLVDETLPGGIADRIGGRGASLDVLPTAPHCTEAAIATVVQQVKQSGSDAIAALGGGKIIDLGRAAADDAGLPFVSVPTVAASDAPCSALAVIYDARGRVVRDRFVRSNPRLVLVDSEVIAEAPLRFFVAGIGDALATYYEADACFRAGAGNLCGGAQTLLAQAAARLCRDTLLEQGIDAVDELRRGQPGEAFQAVLEANILLSGIGFESGGVAAAHAIHHGLADLPVTHGALHGEKVAFGVLVELVLNGVDQSEIAQIARFLRAVGLPTTLGALGVDGSHDALAAIARRASRPGEIIHNEPFAVDCAATETALRRADAIGRRLEEEAA